MVKDRLRFQNRLAITDAVGRRLVPAATVFGHGLDLAGFLIHAEQAAVVLRQFGKRIAVPETIGRAEKDLIRGAVITAVLPVHQGQVLDAIEVEILIDQYALFAIGQLVHVGFDLAGLGVSAEHQFIGLHADQGRTAGLVVHIDDAGTKHIVFGGDLQRRTVFIGKVLQGVVLPRSARKACCIHFAVGR